MIRRTRSSCRTSPGTRAPGRSARETQRRRTPSTTCWRLLDAAAVPALARGQLSNSVWAMVRRQVEKVLARWREPDHGIWSLRAEPHHYTVSKVMCWVAADRGAWLAELRGRPEKAEEWRATAARSRRRLRQASPPGTFRQHYDSDELDSSLLIIPLVGFLLRRTSACAARCLRSSAS